jgi:hypothetical protein
MAAVLLYEGLKNYNHLSSREMLIILSKFVLRKNNSNFYIRFQQKIFSVKVHYLT